MHAAFQNLQKGVKPPVEVKLTILHLTRYGGLRVYVLSKVLCWT